MLNARIADLIQTDVDGELVGKDRAELSRELLQSPEARQFRDEMVRVAGLMAATPSQDPPAGLQQRIIDAIKLPNHGQFGVRSARWFQPASYGLAVAAGVLMAVGLGAVGLGQVNLKQTQDLSALVGTMVSQGQNHQGAVSDTLGIELAHVRGDIKLKRMDNAMALEFDLASTQPVEIMIDFGESGMQVGGFAGQDQLAGVEKFEVSGGEVRLMSRANHHYVLFLRSKPESTRGSQEIAIALGQEGETIYQGLLKTN